MNGAPTHVELFDWKPKLKELHSKPIPDSYTHQGKRFSTMTGNAAGKLILGPLEESSNMARVVLDQSKVFTLHGEDRRRSVLC